MRTALVTAAGAAAALAFLLGALAPRTGAEAAFAATLLCLVVAACAGPACFTGCREGALRCAALAAGAALVCGVAGRDGPLAAAVACGLLCGLFAFALGAVADLLGGGPLRVLAAAAGLAALATFFYWDEAFLLDAANRKASAALAFRLNPAAAASVTLGFDWIHAKALYTNNQTAESMLGVPLRGIGPWALELLAAGGGAAALGAWRRKRWARS